MIFGIFGLLFSGLAGIVVIVASGCYIVAAYRRQLRNNHHQQLQVVSELTNTNDTNTSISTKPSVDVKSQALRQMVFNPNPNNSGPPWVNSWKSRMHVSDRTTLQFIYGMFHSQDPIVSTPAGAVVSDHLDEEFGIDQEKETDPDISNAGLNVKLHQRSASAEMLAIPVKLTSLIPQSTLRCGEFIGDLVKHHNSKFSFLHSHESHTDTEMNDSASVVSSKKAVQDEDIFGEHITTPKSLESGLQFYDAVSGDYGAFTPSRQKKQNQLFSPVSTSELGPNSVNIGGTLRNPMRLKRYPVVSRSFSRIRNAAEKSRSASRRSQTPAVEDLPTAEEDFSHLLIDTDLFGEEGTIRL